MADDIASLIANAGKTNADFNFGKIADAYYKGQEQAQKQRQLDAFSEGLPKDASGNIDWSAAAETIAKIGGTTQLSNVLPLLKFKILQGLADEEKPSETPRSSTPGPQSSNFPPSTSRTAMATVPDELSGTPAPPGQNLTGPNTQVTGVEYGPTQTGGKGDAVTSRVIAAKTGADATRIASSLGVGPDDPININDPAVRANVVKTVRYTQASPQGGPQPQEALALAAPQGGQPNPLQNYPQVTPPPQQDQPQDPMQAQLLALGQQRLAQMQQPQPQAQPVAPQARPPLQPPPGQPAPLTVGPQGNISEANAARYEQIANEAFRKSVIAGSAGDAAMSAAFKARAEAAMKQAEIIRGALAKNAETTPGQKDAAAGGFQSPNAAEVAKAGEVELSKQDVTDFSKRNTAIQQLGTIADNGIEKARLMKQLTLDKNFYSGPLHEGVQTYNQFKAIFGRDPSSAVAQEAFNKVTNDMLTEQIKAMGQSGVGRVLMAEVQNMKSALASQAITPQTNRALAEMITRVYQQNKDIAAIARGIPHVPGQMNPALDAAIAKYHETHRMFSPQEMQNPSLIGAPDAPPQSAQWNNAQKRQWAEGIGLKPGDPIRFNGRILQVP